MTSNELTPRVEALEKDSHPPVDFTPMLNRIEALESNQPTMELKVILIMCFTVLGIVSLLVAGWWHAVDVAYTLGAQ